MSKVDTALLPDAFWTRVVAGPGECWVWTGYTMPNGYGKWATGYGSRLAHRIAYTVLVGSTELHLDHLCHTHDAACPGGVCLHRRCVNPAHLEPVTLQENLARGRRYGDACKAGHPMSGPNLYVYTNGRRKCLQCQTTARRLRLGQTARRGDTA